MNVLVPVYRPRFSTGTGMLATTSETMFSRDLPLRRASRLATRRWARAGTARYFTSFGITKLRPLTAASACAAIYRPQWLKMISLANPLSYVVEAMRSLLVTGDLSVLPKDLAAILIATAIMITLASLSFRRIIT